MYTFLLAALVYIALKVKRARAWVMRRPTTGTQKMATSSQRQCILMDFAQLYLKMKERRARVGIKSYNITTMHVYALLQASSSIY